MTIRANSKGAFLRRPILFGMAALLLTSAAQAAPPAATKTSLRTSLHQEADFAASPQQVFEALIDAKRFAAITGAPAQIQAGEGGTFTLFGGAIGGRNVELVAGKRVVQAWRSNDWAPGVYSMVAFELTPRGPGTHLVLEQTGFPQGDFEGLSQGWGDHYWKPMRKYFH